MKPYQKALIATALTVFFLYKTISDTAAGYGLLPVNAMRDMQTLVTNLTYLVPLILSVIWLLKSVREMAQDKDE